MNTIYRIVWNAATGKWVVASELAKGRKKKSKLLLSAIALVGLIAGMGTAAAQSTPTKLGDNAVASCESTAPADFVNPVSANGTLVCGTAIGNHTTGNRGGTAIGDHSATSESYGVALGAYSLASSRATALGPSAMATGWNSFAGGVNAQASGTNSFAGGANAQALGAQSVAIGSDAKAFQQSSAAMGDRAQAISSQSVALGLNAVAGLADVNGNPVGMNQIALGVNTQALGDRAVAIGAGAAVAAEAGYAVAMGRRATVTSAATNSVALGNLSVADRANTVSVGAVGAERQIASVAKGTADTDAVNVSQLKGTAASIADAFGGGSTVALDGTITAPTYSVGGTNVHNVGDALSNLDGRVTTNAGDITNIRNELINGSIGLVQQDAASGDITVAKATNGTRVDFTGTEGARKLAGVAAGELSATSTEAVNGSQLFATNERVTTAETSITNIDGRVTKNEGDITNLDGRVTTNEGDIVDIRNQLGNGSIGLVQQDTATGDITVAKDTNGTLVDFTGTEGARKLAGVAEGELSATSAEAVNGSQLFATNERVTTAETNITNIDGRVTKNEGDITNLDSRVTTNEGDITNIRNELGNGSIGLVQQDAATGNITVAKDTNGTLVDFTGTDGARKLAGVAEGELSETSTEAVNGSQLFATNERVTKNEGDIINLDGRVTTNEGDIVDIRNQLGSGSIGLVQQDAATGNITVAKDTNGTLVDFTGTEGVRKLAGVAEGELSETSAEAVNGSQLFATNERVTTAETNITNIDGRVTKNEGDITNLDSRVTTNEGDITNIRNELGNGSIGLVQQDATTGDITVAKDTNGTLVDFTGTDGARKLTGVAEGELSETSAEAVNGSQLFATNERVTNAETNITNIDSRVTKNEGDITNLDSRVTTNEGDITNIRNELGNGSIGLVQQDAATGNITVAKDTNGTLVDFTGTEGARKLAGVAEGELSETSTEAVNGSQLFATNERVTTAETNITNIDNRVTKNEGDIIDLGDRIINGSVGLVQQAGASAAVTVAAATGGSIVDFTGTDGTRQLKGVSKGEDATDAVNVAQLRDELASATAGDTPYFKANGANDGTDDAIATGDKAVAIGANARTGGDGAVALGQGASAQGANSVALGSGSLADRANSVSVGSAGNERQIVNVADGTEDTDAVNLRQLKRSGLVGDDGSLMDAVVYDAGSNRSSITLGGVAGTTITNVMAGLVAPGSMDAINGSQLWGVQDQINKLGDRVTTIENGGGSGGGGSNPSPDQPVGEIPHFAANGDAGKPATATGGSSVAAGEGAAASGNNSTAIGAGSSATGDNSVAIGAGSVADRDNTVSVGSAGNERRVTNVAAGTERTDAANVGQLQDAMSNMQDWTQGQVNGLSKKIDNVQRQANRGIAASAALVNNMPYLPGKVTLNAGVATYRGQNALGVGVSRWSDNGRFNLNAGISAAQGDAPIFRVGVGVVLGD